MACWLLGVQRPAAPHPMQLGTAGSAELADSQRVRSARVGLAPLASQGDRVSYQVTIVAMRLLYFGERIKVVPSCHLPLQVSRILVRRWNASTFMLAGLRMVFAFASFGFLQIADTVLGTLPLFPGEEEAEEGE